MAIIFPASQTGEVVGESWRITSSFTGDNNLIGGNSLVNWELSDDVYGGSTQSSAILSHSNGQFTFGSEYYGYYFVFFSNYSYFNDNNQYNELSLMVSWNSGANWDTHAWATCHFSPNTSANYNSVACNGSVVAGTSAARLRFNLNAQNNSATTYGDTTGQGTGFTIIKIADIT